MSSSSAAVSVTHHVITPFKAFSSLVLLGRYDYSHTFTHNTNQRLTRRATHTTREAQSHTLIRCNTHTHTGMPSISALNGFPMPLPLCNPHYTLLHKVYRTLPLTSLSYANLTLYAFPPVYLQVFPSHQTHHLIRAAVT